MANKLADAILALKRDEVLEQVRDRAGKNENPVRILNDARDGMTMVGDKFQSGDYYLAELMLSASMFKEVVTELGPYLSKMRPPSPLAKMVLGTLKGDIHDLGKNIFKTLIEAQGIRVHDLGVDVGPEVLIAKVKEIQPEFVGFSSLLTSNFESMKQAVSMLEDEGVRDGFKLMIGGGVTTPMVKEYLKADFQTIDAMEGLNYCLKEIGGK
jgi:dimethylamine corrinoid protein